MSLRDFLNAARKHWVLVLLPVLVLCAAVGYMSTKATPVYRASATVYVSLSSGSSATDLNQGSSYTQAQMLSFAQLAVMPIVLQPVIDTMDLGVTPKRLADRVSASTPSGTSLLTVSVTGASPTNTAEVANAVAGELTRVITRLAPVTENGTGAIAATIVREAVPAQFPFSPNTKRSLMATGFAGLLIGLVGAYLREVLDTRVRTTRDVDAAIGVPVLGAVRAVKRQGGFTLTELEGGGGVQGEDFRRIRTNVQMIGRVGSPKVFVVSSAITDEGKSHTALRMAASFAAAGERVLLVDADLRWPSIALELGLEGGAGLTDCLVGRATFEEVAQEYGERLTVLVSGVIPPNPSELLASHEFEEIVAIGRDRFDVTVIDAPPLLPVADAVVISRLAVGLVLVVDASRVRRAQIQRAVEVVRMGGGRVVGAVLNRAKVSSDEAAYYAAGAHTKHRRRRAVAKARSRGSRVKAPTARRAAPSGSSATTRRTDESSVKPAKSSKGKLPRGTRPEAPAAPAVEPPGGPADGLATGQAVEPLDETPQQTSPTPSYASIARAQFSAFDDAVPVREPVRDPAGEAARSVPRRP